MNALWSLDLLQCSSSGEGSPWSLWRVPLAVFRLRKKKKKNTSRRWWFCTLQVQVDPFCLLIILQTQSGVCLKNHVCACATFGSLVWLCERFCALSQPILGANNSLVSFSSLRSQCVSVVWVLCCCCCCCLGVRGLITSSLFLCLCQQATLSEVKQRKHPKLNHIYQPEWVSPEQRRAPGRKESKLFLWATSDQSEPRGRRQREVNCFLSHCFF